MKTNPAREALTRAVNRSIASGNPVYVNQSPKTISILVRGVGGEGSATFDYDTWLGMAPIARVLSLHEQCRIATQGKPFDVIGERYQ